MYLQTKQKAMNIEISNWKDLSSQFGFKSDGGLKAAPQIHKELKVLSIKENIPSHVCVECNENSDAICIFVLLSKDEKAAIYEYQGTAN